MDVEVDGQNVEKLCVDFGGQQDHVLELILNFCDEPVENLWIALSA